MVVNTDDGVMVDDTTVDSPTETTTGDDAPETDDVDTGNDAPDTTEEKDKPPKFIPYERLQEVVEDKNTIKSELAEVKEQLAKITQNPSPVPEPTPADPKEEIIKQQLDKYLKDLGYVSKSELQEKEADEKLENTLKSLEQKHDGSDGLPKFERSKVITFARQKLIGDVEAAYQLMYQPQIMDAAIKAALGKTKGVKSEVSDGSGSTQVGTTQDDLKTAAMQGDSDATRTLIKRAIL